MRYYKILPILLLAFSIEVFGAAPQRYNIQDFFGNAKLIAMGIVLSGNAQPKNKPDNICGATFDVLIESEILGAKAGEIVKVHHLIDGRFPSLEIGSRYFFYAEDKSTHEFMVLGDSIDVDLFDERPEECHSSHTNLYIYREFTQKIDEKDGVAWVGDFEIDSWHGLQQIVETRKLPRVYSGFKDGKYGLFLESLEYGFEYGEKVGGGALALEPVMELFRFEYKKSLKEPKK